MSRLNQNACASYSIMLCGNTAQLKEAAELLEDVINDHGCFSDYLQVCLNGAKQKYSRDKYVEDDEDDWDDDDDYEGDLDDAYTPQVKEEYFEIEETHACVWIEDILQLANDLAYYIPALSFSFSGHIEDSTHGVEDMMDFEIGYIDKKLTIKQTCWYICIYMDDFEDYDSFAQKFSDQHGNPRYSEEDYQGFLDCANSWYVLDSGQGEFSVDVPFEKSVRIKIKKPKKVY